MHFADLLCGHQVSTDTRAPILGEEMLCPACPRIEGTYQYAQVIRVHDPDMKISEGGQMESFTRGMKRTAAQIDGIDNSWNLLHIASGLLPYCLQEAIGTIDRNSVAAKLALTYADALLKEWRKSQGDDYGD